MGAKIPPLVKLPTGHDKLAARDNPAAAGGTGFEPWWDKLKRTEKQDTAQRFNVPAHIFDQSQSTNYASAKADDDYWKRAQDHVYRKLEKR